MQGQGGCVVASWGNNHHGRYDSQMLVPGAFWWIGRSVRWSLGSGDGVRSFGGEVGAEKRIVGDMEMVKCQCSYFRWIGITYSKTKPVLRSSRWVNASQKERQGVRKDAISVMLIIIIPSSRTYPVVVMAWRLQPALFAIRPVAHRDRHLSLGWSRPGAPHLVRLERYRCCSRLGRHFQATQHATHAVRIVHRLILADGSR